MKLSWLQLLFVTVYTNLNTNMPNRVTSKKSPPLFCGHTLFGFFPLALFSSFYPDSLKIDRVV